MDDCMLRFMENHDEQRIASTFFAGNPWGGLPAMALATLMNRGPIMIYGGQEVGEPARGSQGFSGNDGRTSIFDYSVIPEIQKWYSDGSCDGLRLSDEQKLLRKEYAGLFRLSGDIPIREGAFYDLMWVNEEIPGRNLIYAFLRYHHDAPDPRNNHDGNRGLLIWLIAISFSNQPQYMNIRIPSHALETMGLSNDQRFIFEPVTSVTKESQNLLASQLNSPGVGIQTGRAGYGILQAFFPW
jgi:hypothetical protein